MDLPTAQVSWVGEVLTSSDTFTSLHANFFRILLFIFSVMTKGKFKRCGEGMVANSCESYIFIIGVV
jgi:hypothetical protein